MSKKLSAQEYAEIRSEDPSQLIDKACMDISPSSPWKTPDKIDTDEAGKNDDDTAHTHPTRHVTVKETEEPVISELRKISNNPDAIWWVDNHVETLTAAVEKPDWHSTYKLWAKDENVDAIEEFMVCVQGGH